MSQYNKDFIHNQFRLNGIHYSRIELISLAKNYIAIGAEFEIQIGDFLLNWFDDNQIIELQTSGSTGIPKIIKVEKKAMINSAIATGELLEIRPGNKALLCLPVKYVAGKMMLVRAIILGLDIDTIEPNLKPLDNNSTYYDFVAMVPLQVQKTLKELHNVNKLIIGGTKLNYFLEQQLKKLPIIAYETYGMTETITHIAVRKIGESSFTALSNVTLAKDNRDCLIINAPFISDDKIVTNDIVEIINDSQFIFIGRIDNVINSGGIKLYPEQIEQKLQKFINERFIISSKDDNDFGDKIIMIVEGEKREFNADLFNCLEKYEKPKEIIFINLFTETENGKIRRKETVKKALKI
jgi:o-succinylbenzoate---CoA ligase